MADQPTQACDQPLPVGAESCPKCGWKSGDREAHQVQLPGQVASPPDADQTMRDRIKQLEAENAEMKAELEHHRSPKSSVSKHDDDEHAGGKSRK